VNILKSIWEGWKRVGKFIGDSIARVFLTLFYFTIFMPFGIPTRLFGDPLNVRYRNSPTFWLDRSTKDIELDHARRQF